MVSRCTGNMPTFFRGERALYAGKARYSGKMGFLYLTNRRLLFEYEEGLITKHTYVSLDVPLSKIENAMMEKPRFGLGPMVDRLVITTKRGSMGFGMNRILLSDMATPEVWVGKIHDAIAGVYGEGQTEPEEAKTIVTREVVKIPCKYCGALLDPVRDSACPTCGAPVIKT